MCSLSLSLSPSLVFFPFPCVSSEWESVCIHEDQLEGIPISTTGFFPSVVLFSAEGTVLFHLNECASSIALCVCVCLCVYLGCTGAMTERTLHKCHPMYPTPQLHLIHFTADHCKHLCLYLHVSVCLPDLTPHCEMMVSSDYSCGCEYLQTLLPRSGENAILCHITKHLWF